MSLECSGVINFLRQARCDGASPGGLYVGLRHASSSLHTILTMIELELKFTYHCTPKDGEPGNVGWFEGRDHVVPEWSDTATFYRNGGTLPNQGHKIVDGDQANLIHIYDVLSELRSFIDVTSEGWNNTEGDPT
jgi:hypothetical protein